MMDCRRLVAVLLVGLWLCATAHGTEANSVYFVRDGIHTEVAVSTADIRTVAPSLVEHIQTDRVSFGWGDKGYFGTGSRNPLVLAKALFWPSSATLKISPYAAPASGVVREIALTVEERTTMIDFIVDTAKEGRVQRRDGDALYVHARGNYTLFNTCNNWTGRTVKKAGLRVAPWRSWLAGLLDRQVDNALDARMASQ